MRLTIWRAPAITSRASHRWTRKWRSSARCCTCARSRATWAISAASLPASLRAPLFYNAFRDKLDRAAGISAAEKEALLAETASQIQVSVLPADQSLESALHSLPVSNQPAGGALSGAEAMQLLEDVSQAGDYPTLWSVVYNLSQGSLTLAVGRDDAQAKYALSAQVWEILERLIIRMPRASLAASCQHPPISEKLPLDIIEQLFYTQAMDALSWLSFSNGGKS